MSLDVKALGKKLVLALNTIATVGATLQASGQLSLLGPTGMAIAAVIIAVANAVVHALPVQK